MANIKVQNEDSMRNVINIGGLPEKTEDVVPINSRFAFKDDESESSIKTESIHSSSYVHKNIPPKHKPFNHQYEMYADPKKTTKQESEEEYSDSETESESSGGSDEHSVASENSEMVRGPKRPALSRLQLKIKKKDMLLKLHEAEQNGYQLTCKYSMLSELEEMEAEYELYEQKMEQSTMIDFMQDGLMFIIKGIEVLNGIYNPLSLKLNGLSDKVYDRKEKLEHVFRRLAIKYSGGTEMPPEMSILFIIGGAMVMTHMSNTALQGGGIPGLGNILGGSNIMESISSLMGNITQPVASNQPTNKEMKPPNIDISNILNSMKDITSTKPLDERDNLPFKAMNIPNPQPFPQSSRRTDYANVSSSPPIDESDRFSESSSVSSVDETTTQSVTISVPSRNSSRRGKRSIQI